MTLAAVLVGDKWASIDFGDSKEDEWSLLLLVNLAGLFVKSPGVPDSGASLLNCWESFS